MSSLKAFWLLYTVAMGGRGFAIARDIHMTWENGRELVRVHACLYCFWSEFVGFSGGCCMRK